MEVEPTLYKNPPSKILEHKVLRIGPNHPNLEHLGGPWNGLDPRDGGKNEAAVGCPGVPPCLPQPGPSTGLVLSRSHWKHALQASSPVATGKQTPTLTPSRLCTSLKMVRFKFEVLAFSPLSSFLQSRALCA